MRRIDIEPYDVFLVRDARPFGVADAAGSAVGLFPPPPSAVYGAIRTAAYRALGAELHSDGPPTVPGEVRAVWGDATTGGTVCLRGPVLRCGRTGALWPAPATLLRQKAGDNRRAGSRISAPVGGPRIVAASLKPGLRASWLSAPGVYEPIGGFVTNAGLREFLAGRPPAPPEHRDEEDLVAREERIGIGLDRSRRTVSTGALFTMGFRRLKEGVALSAWIDGEGAQSLPGEGVLRLGQDGKLARYAVGDAIPNDWPAAPNPSTGRFLIYLATPALFSRGWVPSWVDSETLTVKHAVLRGRLVSVALERPQMLGGWDLAKRRPRALRRLVRAGSVYFFQCETSEDAHAAVKALHGQCISERAGDSDGGASEGAPEIGFGLSFTGVW